MEKEVERWETHVKCKPCNGTGEIITKYVKSDKPDMISPDTTKPSNLYSQTTMLELWLKFLETKIIEHHYE